MAQENGKIRTLMEDLFSFRDRLARVAGKTFDGKRDVYRALGYKADLTVEDYRARFNRNEVANRIVKAFPVACWRGGADIVEDDDPETVTPFEQEVLDLDKRLKLWDKVRRADILSGIGRYAILLIGAPGELDTPLEHASAKEILFLQPYGEDDAKVEKFIEDGTNERFGYPEFYSLNRTTVTNDKVVKSKQAKRVHWTRAIHLSDGLLDDNIFGEPRLRCVWNRIDDLEKVAGGGAEAFWRRADRGTQFDLDPEVKFDDEDAAVLQMQQQLKEYEHGFRRYLTTRGVTAKELGSDVADFKSPVEAIISLISAGTGIPQRVLIGSEQGKLAAKQDAANWDNRVTDRQNDYCGPVARLVIDKFIALGALTETDYDVKFSSVRTMDAEQRATIANSLADVNQKMGKTVITVDEIRTNILDYEPLEDVDEAAAAANDAPEPTPAPVPAKEPDKKPRAASEDAPSDAAILAVLEAAIDADKTDVVDHILGIRRPKNAEETKVVVQQLESLQASQPALANEIKQLAAAVAEGFTKQPAAPVINIEVKVPPVQRTQKIIKRDAAGLVASVVEEVID